jgi:hypothetical protein
MKIASKIFYLFFVVFIISGCSQTQSEDDKSGTLVGVWSNGSVTLTLEKGGMWNINFNNGPSGEGAKWEIDGATLKCLYVGDSMRVTTFSATVTFLDGNSISLSNVYMLTGGDFLSQATGTYTRIINEEP